METMIKETWSISLIEFNDEQPTVHKHAACSDFRLKEHASSELSRL
uniref:Uncharacterized protein n=1 Tax=Arundo donax TaxID=35708 RepID=A0A0A9DVQ0_ARUDO